MHSKSTSGSNPPRPPNLSADPVHRQWRPNIGAMCLTAAPGTLAVPEFSAVQAAFAAGLLSEAHYPVASMYPVLGRHLNSYHPYEQNPADAEEEDWEGMKYEPGDQSLAAIESVIKPHDSNKRRISRSRKRSAVTAAVAASALVGSLGEHLPSQGLNNADTSASSSHISRTRGDGRSFTPDDVRAQYPKILERIYNGVHRDFAEKNFRAICREDCVMVTRSQYNPFGPNYREVHGIPSIVEFIDALNEAIPDNLFTMKESKYQKKPKGKMCIVTSFTIHGHIIYKVHTNDYHNVEDIDSAVIGLAMLTQQQEQQKEPPESNQRKLLLNDSCLLSGVFERAAHDVGTKRSSEAMELVGQSTYSQITKPHKVVKKQIQEEDIAIQAKDVLLGSESSNENKNRSVNFREDAPLLAASLKQIHELNSNTPAVTAAANGVFSLRGTAPADARNQLLSSLSIKHIRTASVQPVQNDSGSDTNFSTDADSNGSTPKHSAGDRKVDSLETVKSRVKTKENELMIVAPNAKFHLSKRIDLGCSEYNVKGTMTLMVDSDWKICKIDMVNAFDTTSHRERTDL